MTDLAYIPCATPGRAHSGGTQLTCPACVSRAVAGVAPVAVKAKRDGSHAEDLLASQMKAVAWNVLTMAEWVDALQSGRAEWALIRQFPWGLTLDAPRGFKGDFVCVQNRTIVEVDGKAHDMKRKSDTIRRQLAEAGHWRVVNILSEQVRDGTALGVVKSYFDGTAALAEIGVKGKA